jgi:hypothetical protein
MTSKRTGNDKDQDKYRGPSPFNYAQGQDDRQGLDFEEDVFSVEEPVGEEADDDEGQGEGDGGDLG